MKPLVYKKSRTRPDAREPERHKMHIAKGDTVRVISGEHRGKEGKVLRVFPKEFRVEVEGVNIVKKHKRAANPNQESGIIELTAPIAASRSEEHTSELQSQSNLVCRLLLEKKKQ